MSNRKSNPVMSPEWLDSLLSVDVVPDGVLQVEAEYEEFAEQSTAADLRSENSADFCDDRHLLCEENTLLVALRELIVRLWDGKYEDARQATQTINRLLATGSTVDPEDLRDCLFGIVE